MAAAAVGGILAEKQALRVAAAKAMRELQAPVREAQSAAVCARTRDWVAQFAANAASADSSCHPRGDACAEVIVTGYLAMPHELDLGGLFAALWARNDSASGAVRFRTMVPKMLAAGVRGAHANDPQGRGGEMVFAEVMGADDLRTSFAPVPVGKSMTILELQDDAWDVAVREAAAGASPRRLVVGPVPPFAMPLPPESGEPAPARPLAVVVLAPAAAFDRHGHRLGKGGGYYDRFVRELRAAWAKCSGSAPRVAVVGVCFDEQVLPEGVSIPQERHDEAADVVIAPSFMFDSTRTL